MVEDTVLLDFEFNRTTEEFVNLVCCTTQEYRSGKTLNWWLHKNPKTQKKLATYLRSFDNIVAYAAIAEARSLLSLGLDPLKFDWIDLFLEYRCLTNHNDELQWGPQYQNRRIITASKPLPKWQQTEEDKKGGFVATHSLSEATFKLLGKKIDTLHKDTMRDLIISDPVRFTPKEQRAIMEYCASDVVNLKPMWKKCIAHYKTLDRELTTQDIKDNAFTKGRYSAHTALMESRGYPIDVKKTRNFSKQVGNILFELQREINGLFPDIAPFRWNKKEQRYSENQKNIKDWIRENEDMKRWTKTKKGDVSLALDAWTKVHTYAHDYPEDSFPAQMIRYGKLKQSIYGFNASPGGKRKNFWDSVGSDNRVRPYMNIYKAQSSRSQPAASGFMFLKPAWMRALVLPDKGKFMAGIDYGSEEFFISALEAADKNMIHAYLSGDPYFSFAKLSGQVPMDAVRKDYEDIRNLNKATILGISYLMSKYGLSAKLSADTGKPWTEDEAQEQIDLFYETFSDLKEYQENIQMAYAEDGYLALDDGWYMWGDNENHRSVTNMRIQGMGAAIMRRAVDYAHEEGIDVSFTLHDALYMEGNIGEEYKILKLRDCMREAFAYFYEEDFKEEAMQIRLDPFAWSRDYKPNSQLNIEGVKIPASNLYVDKRSIKDYEKFSPYFEDRAEDIL